MKLTRTNDPQYARDARGAVLNIDNKAFEQYKKQRDESLVIKQVVQDVSDLKKDIALIKELLGTLVANG